MMPPDDPPTSSPNSAPDIRRCARPAHRRDAHLGGARGIARRRRLRSVRRLLPAPGHRRSAAVAGACRDGNAASAVERLWLHLATRPQRHRARAIRPRQHSEQIFGSRALSTPSSERARDGEDNPSMRRRLELGPEERDFPVLEEFFAAGRDGLRRPSLRLRRDRATARRERASSIRSRPIVRAASATTTRRCCRRPCPRFRWR